MNYILDIVSRFVPVGMTTTQADVFIGVGCFAFLSLLAYIFYRIVRIFI